MYEATTNDITVKVVPNFLEEDSAPLRDYYFWAYTVDILNEGKQRVQLLARHWQITDMQGRTQEVRGAGVVGEQPTLDPGENFRYTSGVPLRTPSGIMLGWYTMETEDGETFEVEVPAFSLDSPYAASRPN
ncbi:MAG: Co2+/Mg2+ efflux protein ApaG [Rhodomicrobium sp.]|nr:Co2+/Mg2+ efflux protein ApaG [Rhodomicrobium sp.]